MWQIFKKKIQEWTCKKHFICNDCKNRSILIYSNCIDFRCIYYRRV